MLRVVTYFGGVILGIFFIFFGLNGFFNFAPSEHFTGCALQVVDSLKSTHYFFHHLNGMEVIAGLTILLNKYKRLGLVILAPILINIILFHLFLMPLVTSIIPVCLFILWVIQVFEEKRFFTLLFKSY
jgi:putative oxidoreductase